MFALLRLIRRFIGLVVLAVVLLVGGLVALFFHMDTVARELVERGTTASLGVESTTERVNVSPLRRSVGVDRLTVANPEGYRGPLLMETERVDVSVEPRTLFSEVIVVPLAEFDGMTLHIEHRDGRNNFAPILDHMREQREEPPRRRVQVDRVVIRNVTAHIEAIEQLGRLGRVTVEVPEIVLEDVTGDEARGIAVAELMRRVIPAVLAAVLEKGDDIPGEVTHMLTDNLSELAAEAGGRVGRIIGEGLEGMVDNLTPLLDRLFNTPEQEPD